MKDDILHKVRVQLYENLLTDDPNDYSAKVISERSLSTREICQSAVKRGGAASTAEAMEHNVNLFLKEMAYQLMDGFSVNTGYFVANVQVRGVFNSPNEQFNSAKHAVLFRFNQGELLRKEIPTITVQVMGLGDSSIVISHVTDLKTGSVNDLLTPGGALKIRGGKLKMVGDSSEIGIYFTTEKGNAYKVEENDIITNKPAELIVMIPKMPTGKYKLMICNQFCHGSQGDLLKKPRATVYEKEFTVL